MNLTAETMALMKAALNPNGLNGGDLHKSISTAAGLTYYDLQAPAKNLYPVITIFRNKIPRVGRPSGYGTQANWKVVSAIQGSGFDAMGWVPEGQRSGAMSYVTANASAPYVTIGEEDWLTFEAESAAQGFEDVNATLSMRLLQKMMRKEETGLLGGNSTLQLGTPSAPTLSANADVSSTLPSATYSVIVVALTQEGWNNCKGNAAVGFTPAKTITGMDGQTYVLNGGASNKSSNTTQATVSGTSGLAASVTLIKGAVAYAWFVGLAGAETLQAITTVNCAYFNAPLATGRQAISTITADCSTNPTLAMDGLLTNAFKGGTNNTLATGTAGVGTFLTASGAGGVKEIDNVLQTMWQNFNLGPSAIYVSAQEQKNISSKVLTGASSAPLLRYDVPAVPGQPFGITAGGQVKYYFNPYTSGATGTPGGGETIPIISHPDMAPGTIYFHCDQLPEQYISNEVPNVAEVITRRDYYRVDWPLRTRRREYGVYAEEVLAVYAQFALATLSNIGNG